MTGGIGEASMASRENSDGFSIDGNVLHCPEDMRSTPPRDLASWCAKLMATAGRELLVDLTATRHLASQHLGILAEAWSQALSGGRQLELMISPGLRRLFETSGFDKVFKLREPPEAGEGA